MAKKIVKKDKKAKKPGNGATITQSPGPAFSDKVAACIDNVAIAADSTPPNNEREVFAAALEDLLIQLGPSLDKIAAFPCTPKQDRIFAGLNSIYISLKTKTFVTITSTGDAAGSPVARDTVDLVDSMLRSDATFSLEAFMGAIVSQVMSAADSMKFDINRREQNVAFAVDFSQAARRVLINHQKEEVKQ